MKPGHFLQLFALGCRAAVLRLFRRSGITYPPPMSLVMDLPADTLPHRDGPNGRFITLEGAVNVRDLGGYRTRDDRHVRWERVFRSGALAGITREDQRVLLALNLKQVCDLRSDTEVAAAPDQLPAGILYRRIPTKMDRPADILRKVRVLLLERENAGIVLDEIYRRMIDEEAGVFGEIFRQLSDPGNLPLLFHCSAGKDRAGLTTALLLLALGIPEEVVIADYSQSNRYYDSFVRLTKDAVRKLALFGITQDHMYPVLVANPETLRMALDYLRGRYGSVEDYLRNEADLDEITLEKMKANLLV